MNLYPGKYGSAAVKFNWYEIVYSIMLIKRYSYDKQRRRNCCIHWMNLNNIFKYFVLHNFITIQHLWNCILLPKIKILFSHCIIAIHTYYVRVGNSQTTYYLLIRYNFVFLNNKNVPNNTIIPKRLCLLFDITLSSKSCSQDSIYLRLIGWKDYIHENKTANCQK